MNFMNHFYLHTNILSFVITVTLCFFSKTCCLAVHTNLHLSINCRCKISSSECLMLPRWNMKQPAQLEEQVLCGLPEVVRHWLGHWRATACMGTEQSVLFQHSLLDEGPFHRHYGLIFGRISPGSDKIGCLTSCALSWEFSGDKPG